MNQHRAAVWIRTTSSYLDMIGVQPLHFHRRLGVYPLFYYFVDVVSATGAAVESTATESVATAVESATGASALALLPCPQLAIVRAMAATANKLFIMIVLLLLFVIQIYEI
jgi:hypothetical protein